MKFLAIYFITLLLFAGSALDSLAQTTFFVAPDGKNTNDGTKESPFKSIEKAQSKALNRIKR